MGISLITHSYLCHVSLYWNLIRRILIGDIRILNRILSGVLNGVLSSTLGGILSEHLRGVLSGVLSGGSRCSCMNGELRRRDGDVIFVQLCVCSFATRTCQSGCAGMLS